LGSIGLCVFERVELKDLRLIPLVADEIYLSISQESCGFPEQELCCWLLTARVELEKGNVFPAA